MSSPIRPPTGAVCVPSPEQPPVKRRAYRSVLPATTRRQPVPPPPAGNVQPVWGAADGEVDDGGGFDMDDGDGYGCGWDVDGVAANEMMGNAAGEQPQPGSCQGQGNRPWVGGLSLPGDRARRARDQRNEWRHQFHADFFATYCMREDLSSRLTAALQAALAEAMADTLHACPHCLAEHACVRRWRKVGMVCLEQRFLLDVPVMACGSCQHEYSLHPLQLGCMPATLVAAADLVHGAADRMVVWYSLALLAFCDTQLNTLRRWSITRFVEALQLHHAAHGTPLQLSDDMLRRTLGAAVQEYGYLQGHLANLSKHGVAEYPSGPFAHCGACWKQLHSAYIDGCFKLAHLRAAGGDDEPPPNLRFFLPDGDVRDFLATEGVAADPGDDDKQCSDFDAAKALSKRNKQRDITGTEAAVCRHHQPIVACNMYVGERYAFATLLLATIIAVWGRLVQFVWYDINCRYRAHWLLWMAATGNQLAARINAVLGGTNIQWPLPYFHRFMHSEACQRTNSPVKMEGSGRGHGEPPEQLWSAIGEHGKITQYMSRTNRLGRLERVLQFYSERMARGLPSMLVRMLGRAQTARQDSARRAEVADKKLRELALSREQINDKMRAHVAEEAQHDASSTASKPWQAQYVELHAQLACAQQQQQQQQQDATPACHQQQGRDSPVLLPSASIVFADKAFRKLDSASAHMQRVRKQIATLEKRHLDGESLSTSSPVFRSMVPLYYSYEVARLQAELVTQSLQFRYHNSELMQHMSNSPAAQDAIRAKMDSAKASLGALLDKLKAVVRAGSATLSPVVLEQLQGCAGWQVSNFVGGVPWQPDGVGAHSATVAAVSIPKLVSQLATAMREHMRAKEEEALVLREMADTWELACARHSAVEAAVQQMRDAADADRNGQGQPSLSSSGARQSANGAIDGQGGASPSTAAAADMLQQQGGAPQTRQDRACAAALAGRLLFLQQCLRSLALERLHTCNTLAPHVSAARQWLGSTTVVMPAEQTLLTADDVLDGDDAGIMQSDSEDDNDDAEDEEAEQHSDMQDL